MSVTDWLTRRALEPGWHLLHIPKTGGTAVKAALTGVAAVTLDPHAVRLRDLPDGARAILFVRDPLARFVSGFNSRLRQGKPRYDMPWSRAEAAAFARFPTADALGAGLSTDPDAARQAMAAIQHSARGLSYWLGDRARFAADANKVGFVGQQETLAADFAALRELLDLPPDRSLPADPVVAHVAPADSVVALGDVARANLTARYAEDFALHADCLALRDARLEALPPLPAAAIRPTV